jgi:guanylate kinase
MIFVVTGPSGCGKSTLIRRVRDELGGLSFSVSHTTRRRRVSERAGVDYHFVTLDGFERMAKRREFVEWAEVHGHLYGTSRAEVERKGRRGDVVLDIDVQGARQVRTRIPGAVQVFIMPPRFAELRRRLVQRGSEDPAAVERRLLDACREVLAFAEFDYVVVNDDLETAVEELRSVIVAARCRPANRTEALGRILRTFSRPRPRAGPRRRRRA